MNGKTVIIVDDEAPTRQAYAEYLREYGYRTLEAANGGEAILLVYLELPDIILMDITMPVLDGIETAESLRAFPATAGVRILAVTGTHSLSQQERMWAVCDDMLLKPCDPEQIASRIRSLLESGSAGRKVEEIH